MQKVQDIKKSSLTFAPEAGSQRLRNVINKGLTVEDILGGAGQAFEGGWNKVKLYFMLGLPTETEEDMRAIPELANQIAALYYDIVPKEKRNGKCQITISTSFFVPKPFTPFQWASMLDPGDYLGRAKIVNDHVKEQGTDQGTGCIRAAAGHQRSTNNDAGDAVHLVVIAHAEISTCISC